MTITLGYNGRKQIFVHLLGPVAASCSHAHAAVVHTVLPPGTHGERHCSHCPLDVRLLLTNAVYFAE